MRRENSLNQDAFVQEYDHEKISSMGDLLNKLQYRCQLDYMLTACEIIRFTRAWHFVTWIKRTSLEQRKVIRALEWSISPKSLGKCVRVTSAESALSWRKVKTRLESQAT